MQKETFIILKPDCFENQESFTCYDVLKAIQEFGFLPISTFTLLHPRKEDIRHHYEDIGQLKVRLINKFVSSGKTTEDAERIAEEIVVRTVDYMSRGPLLVCRLLYVGQDDVDAISEFRRILGPTKPGPDDAWTIRGKFNSLKANPGEGENLVHASDSIEAFDEECAFWVKVCNIPM